jgi:hypothetical protein
MKTSELIGRPLDWAVCKAQGIDYVERFCVDAAGREHEATSPSTDWAQSGPIIEREIAKIERFSDALWEATAFTKNAQDIVQSGPTPLIAAMRCFVASKLGDEVDIPEELQ